MPNISLKAGSSGESAIRRMTRVAVDIRKHEPTSDTAFAEWMARELGVTTVPGSSFYKIFEDGGDFKSLQLLKSDKTGQCSFVATTYKVGTCAQAQQNCQEALAKATDFCKSLNGYFRFHFAIRNEAQLGAGKRLLNLQALWDASSGVTRR